MMRRLALISLIGGVFLMVLGAGMRVYATVILSDTQKRLLADRPVSPVNASPAVTVDRADGPPSRLALPAYGLWNTLTPVNTLVNPLDDQLTWQVTDAGWHVPSGWPGWGQGSNVVVAGHSPSQDPATWSRSVFRQLAYLHPGDEVDLAAGSFLYRYRVGQVFAISANEAAAPSATAWLTPNLGERLTLITCWPPNTAAYRVLVVAYPIMSIKNQK